MSDREIEENKRAIIGLQRAVDALERKVSAVDEGQQREGRKTIDLVEKFKVYVSRNDVVLSTLEDRTSKAEGTLKEVHHDHTHLRGTLEGKQQAEATGRHVLAEVRAEIGRAVPQEPKEDSALKTFMRDNGPLMGLIGIITVLVNLVVRLVEHLVP